MRSNYKQESIKLKSKKGITLIALVITIVVLLILAGVSINVVIGENGIFNNAKDAKTEMNEETAYEKVQVQVLGAINGNGEYDPDIAKENIEKYLGATVEKNEGDDSLAINYNGYDFKFDQNGAVIGRGEKTILQNGAFKENMLFNSYKSDSSSDSSTGWESSGTYEGCYRLCAAWRSNFSLLYAETPINFDHVKEVRVRLYTYTNGGGVEGEFAIGLQKTLTKKDKNFDENLKESESYSESKDLHEIILDTSDIKGNYYLKICNKHDDHTYAMSVAAYIDSIILVND